MCDRIEYLENCENTAALCSNAAVLAGYRKCWGGNMPCQQGQFGELRIDQFMHDGALFLIVFELVTDLRICMHIAEVQ